MQNGTKGTKTAPVSRKLFRRVNWMPITVVILGLLSFALLIWMNKIYERLHMDSALCDAIMDIQISAAVSHLRLEEAIAGNTSVNLEKVFGEIDLAIGLAESMLIGGKSEHHQPLQPLQGLKLRKEMGDIHASLTQFKTIALQRIQNPRVARSGSPLDEAFDAFFTEIQQKADTLEIDLEKGQIRAHTQSKYLFGSTLFVWTLIVAGTTIGLWSGEAKRRHAEEALEKEKDRLEIKVVERTRELRGVHDQLRYLASQLLTAQEKERKRIAAELHDELGASLAVLKIEFTLVEKNLNEDQRELRDRCRHNLEYIEQVADNVSRLSRSLSPYLLEELGLSAALRSLLNNFAKRLNIQVISEIPEMEQLFPQDVETTIYRIIQESLTNISKHAQAQHVSMVTKIDDDGVRFIVEDDGKGFNVEQEIRKDAMRRGMGLTTMKERVRILGGSFDLWSQEGRGTRVTFQIPKKNGGILS